MAKIMSTKELDCFSGEPYETKVIISDDGRYLAGFANGKVTFAPMPVNLKEVAAYENPICIGHLPEYIQQSWLNEANTVDPSPKPAIEIEHSKVHPEAAKPNPKDVMVSLKFPNKTVMGIAMNLFFEFDATFVVDNEKNEIVGFEENTLRFMSFAESHIADGVVFTYNV
jgi:hypothetical protein